MTDLTKAEKEIKLIWKNTHSWRSARPKIHSILNGIYVEGLMRMAEAIITTKGKVLNAVNKEISNETSKDTKVEVPNASLEGEIKRCQP